MDRRANQDLSRYSAAGYVPALYLIEGDGVLKVGMGVSVAVRLQCAHRMFTRMGHKPGRFATFPVEQARGLGSAERMCILALRKVGTNVGGKRELFSGVSFDDACRIVAQFTVSPESHPFND